MKWDPYIHGASDNETNLIDYFKTKFLVMELVWGDGENSFDSNMSLEENINWLHRYHNDPDIPDEHLKLVPVKKIYRYKDRDFAVINYGLEKFQRRYKIIMLLKCGILNQCVIFIIDKFMVNILNFYMYFSY